MARLARWGLFSLFGLYALCSPRYFGQLLALANMGAMPLLALLLYIIGSLSLLIAALRSWSNQARGKFWYLAAALLLAVAAVWMRLPSPWAIYVWGGCLTAAAGLGLSLAHRPEHAPARS